MARPRNLRQAVPGLLATLRRFAPHIREQRGLVVGGAAAMMAEVLLRLAEPWPLKFILDQVVVGDTAGVAGNLDPLWLLGLAAVAIAVLTGLRALTSYLSTVAFALAGNKVLTRVRAELYQHLQRLSLRYHERTPSGDLLTRITGDVGRLQEITVTALLPLVGNVVTFVGMVAVMFWVDAGLTWITLATFPLFGLTMVRLTGRIRTVSRRQRRLEGELASTAAESLGAMTVVQSYSLEETLEADFISSNDKNMRDGVKAKRLAAGLERSTDVMIAIATGVVVFVGARRVLAGALTVGDLVVFITYLKNAFKPMRNFAKYTGRLAKAAASGERIVGILDTEPGIDDRADARPAPTLRGELTFEHVSFGYEPDQPVLHELDLHVPAGARIGLVGPSGAGKSTVVSLLPRLRDVDAGAIRIDGVDVRDYTLASLRQQVAIVLQESVLFATTIRENIVYGNLGADDAAVEHAARIANAHEFIMALPEGYDTVCSERGSTLSGGQRQRIAIARAAIRDAPIVILDEPTAGLDRGSEAEVVAALDNLTQGRTTIVIAHDLASVVDADRILYLEEGRVVEDGTHRDLLARQGRYAALWTLQMATHGDPAQGDGQGARVGDDPSDGGGPHSGDDRHSKPDEDGTRPTEHWVAGDRRVVHALD